jgi:hypothetical protein
MAKGALRRTHTELVCGMGNWFAREKLEAPMWREAAINGGPRRIARATIAVTSPGYFS